MLEEGRCLGLAQGHLGASRAARPPHVPHSHRGPQTHKLYLTTYQNIPGVNQGQGRAPKGKRLVPWASVSPSVE
jgi:hypothetical protein